MASPSMPTGLADGLGPKGVLRSHGLSDAPQSNGWVPRFRYSRNSAVCCVCCDYMSLTLDPACVLRQGGGRFLIPD